MSCATVLDRREPVPINGPGVPDINSGDWFRAAFRALGRSAAALS